MKVTGTVLVDLRGVEDNMIRETTKALVFAPPGARAVLNVGDHRLVDFGTVSMIRDFGSHLEDIDVRGTPDAVRAWVQALRGEQGW